MSKKPARKNAASSDHRKARAYTWQPSTQTERTIATRSLRFHSPEQLIADAAALTPDRQAWRVVLHARLTGKRPILAVNFDASELERAQGLQWHASIYLQQKDVPALAAYLMRLTEFRFEGMLFCELPDSRGDGGEELPVPKISRAELAVMRATTEAIQ